MTKEATIVHETMRVVGEKKGQSATSGVVKTNKTYSLACPCHVPNLIATTMESFASHDFVLIMGQRKNMKQKIH